MPREIMLYEPSADDLRKLPRPSAVDEIPWQDMIIYEHFFIGTCDWYAAAYDPDRDLFFGFVILNHDLANAEWGYFTLAELKEVNVQGVQITRDPRWKERRASDIENIVNAHHWPGHS